MSLVRPSGQHFSVDVALASAYGLNQAFLIHHLQHWIRVNRDRGINFKDDRTWTYQTLQEISDHFPFLNYEQVQYAMEELEKKGVIKKGNYNKRKIDKTIWYAFVDEELFVPSISRVSKNVYEKENSLSIRKIPLPIPDTKPTDTIKPPTKPSSKNESIKPSKNSVGGFFKCLEKLDLSEKDKKRLTSEYSEDLVDKVVMFITTPSFKLKETLDKAIFYFCKNPEHMTETAEQVNSKKLKDQDKKEENQNIRRAYAEKIVKHLWDYFKKNKININSMPRDGFEYLEFNNKKIYYRDEEFREKIKKAIGKENIQIPKWLDDIP